MKYVEPKRGVEIKVPLNKYILNAGHQAYRGPSGMIDLRKPVELGLYQARLFTGVACLGLAYSP